MTKEERNILFEQYEYLIERIVRKNHELLKALGIEKSDAKQELAEEMLLAIEKFDSLRSDSIEKHIFFRLRFKILDLKKKYKPHGIVAFKDGLTFDYIDKETETGFKEIPFYDDNSIFEVKDFMSKLSLNEAEAVTLKLKGYTVRRIRQKKDLKSAGKKLKIYNNEEMRGAA